MKNGDISNELPKRIIVVADVFFEVELTTKRRFKLFPITKINRKVRRELLSYLYLITTNRGVTMEVVSFDLDHEQLEELVETLDIMGTNPFRYFNAYESVDHLVKELPYRPEVIGVLDISNRLLRYGHWGLDFNSL
jgi:hypothetical protein